ncbi:MAG: ribonuclease D [Alphaproteobacteria bacterium]|nr:ribonuclease D [Alphaproteobacteria bacterium]
MTVEVLTDTAQLADFCKELAQEPYLTIDTEFLRDRTYYPQLCLLQMAGKARAAIVDPLAEGIDLAPLFELMANKKVLKVFHSASQDLEILYRLGGTVPEPIFDTQVAAMVCGFGEAASYEKLVDALAGEALDKSSRLTDWSHRPLTDRQLSYAISDVTHLRIVYEKLQKRLHKNGRESWISEEMKRLTDPKVYQSNPDEIWQRLRIRVRTPKYLATVKELAAWREREAQRRDVPRGRLLKDDAILEIAAAMPKNAAAVQKIRMLRQSLSKETTEAIVGIVEKCSQMKPEDCPKLVRKPQLPRGIGPLVDMLKVLLKMKCEELEIASLLVARMDDLEEFAGFDKVQDLPMMHGWRYEAFGRHAEALKAGKIGLAMRKGMIDVVELGGQAA